MSEDLLAASWFRDRENDRTYHEKRDKIFILFFHAPYIVVNSYRFLNLFCQGPLCLKAGKREDPGNKVANSADQEAWLLSHHIMWRPF